MDGSELIARLRERFIPSGSVIDQTVLSGIWEGSLNSLNRAIQLAKITVLAKLLPPAEFGILGIGFLTLAVFEGFSQLGIDAALIQQKDENVDKYLDTSFVLQVARGLVLAVLIFIIAPYAAGWFGEPRATNVIRALGIGPLLLGIKNPGTVYFRKSLQYHRRFAQILSGSLANFGVAVALGVLLGNVWALVAGSIVGNFVSVAVSYRLHQYRPGLKFDLELARELIDFGKWIFGGSIVRFIKNQGDDIFVGWFLGATPLAFYQMAYRFSNAPATELTDVITKVVFPSLSQIQDDYEKLRDGYFRTLRFGTFLAFPAAAGIILVASEFVEVFLGSAWLPIVPVMQALAVWGGIRAMHSANGPVLHTLSRPDIGMKLDVIRVAIIALGIFFAAERYDLIGVAAVLILAATLVSPIEIYLTLNHIDGSYHRYLKNILHPSMGCGFMTAVLFVTKQNLFISMPIIEFVVLVIVGALSYLLYIRIAVAFFKCKIDDDINAVVGSVQ